MQEFKIRTYGRMELAQLYCPELSSSAAYRKVTAWIELYPGLSEKLAALGHDSRRRSYTPMEVRAIVNALGEP